VAIISTFCFVKCKDGSIDKYCHKISSFGNQIQPSIYLDLFIQLANYVASASVYTCVCMLLQLNNHCFKTHINKNMLRNSDNYNAFTLK